MFHKNLAAQAIEILVAGKAYIVKKIGNIHGEPQDLKSSQITWSKNGGPVRAWDIAKHRAQFLKTSGRCEM